MPEIRLILSEGRAMFIADALERREKELQHMINEIDHCGGDSHRYVVQRNLVQDVRATIIKQTLWATSFEEPS